MLRLSPLVTAAKASAFVIPARFRISSSVPVPPTFSPRKSGARGWKGSLLGSLILTRCPALSLLVRLRHSRNGERETVRLLVRVTPEWPHVPYKKPCIGKTLVVDGQRCCLGMLRQHR